LERLADTSRSFFFGWACSQSCFLLLNERHVVLIEPVGTGSKVAQLIEADKNKHSVFCAQETSPRRGSDSMFRLHFAESIILFARELHSRPGNLTKSATDRPFFEGSRAVFCVALPTSAISKVNAIIPRERSWECGFVLFTQ